MNKLEDARKLLPSFNLKHIDFDVPEIQSLDSREIAKYKLEYAYEKVKESTYEVWRDALGINFITILLVGIKESFPRSQFLHKYIRRSILLHLPLLLGVFESRQFSPPDSSPDTSKL